MLNVQSPSVLPLPQAESYYDLPSWTDDEDELADDQQQPAGSTDGSVAAAASEAGEEGHEDGAADSSAAGAAAVIKVLLMDAAAATAPVSSGQSAPVPELQAGAAAAAPEQQQEAPMSCLPAAGQHAGLPSVNGIQQQQQLALLGIGKASEPGNLTSSDPASDKQQQQQQHNQEDQAQPLQTIGEQQQQQGVAKKLEACALAAVADSREAHSGSGVADAVAVDAYGQPTPVRPAKRLKADPAAAE
jgi:hypothetical protein